MAQWLSIWAGWGADSAHFFKEQGADAPVGIMLGEETTAVAHHKHGGSTWRMMKRAVKRFTKKLLGWFLIALGFVLVAAGFVLIIVPGHYFLIVVGLILILRNAYWARRQFIHLKRRHPNWIMPIRKLLRRNPPVVSIFWQQVLKIERFITRGRGALAGYRRRWFRRPRPV